MMNIDESIESKSKFDSRVRSDSLYHVQYLTPTAWELSNLSTKFIKFPHSRKAGNLAGSYQLLIIVCSEFK